MTPQKTTTDNTVTEATQKVVIPVVDEHLVYDAKTVETGRVDIQISTEEERVSIPVPTVHTHYREERVPVDRLVDSDPGIRQEDDRIIVPVLREETVVIKRLRLVEEIHLIKSQEREERQEEIVLRKRQVDVRRTNQE